MNRIGDGMVAVNHIIESLLDNRDLGFQFLIDYGAVVSIKRAHIDAAHKADLIAVQLMQLEQIHTGFNFDDLQAIDSGFDHVRQKRFHKTSRNA